MGTFLWGKWYVTFAAPPDSPRWLTVGPFDSAAAAQSWLSTSPRATDGYSWRYSPALQLPNPVLRVGPTPPTPAYRNRPLAPAPPAG